MRVLGIVAEFNPFHNGHEYLIQHLRQQTGASHTVVVMSGHFVQRGGIAVFDKWTRAKAAVLGGADMVLELPVCHVLKSAEGFAAGGVALLDALRCVDFIGFGSESGDVHAIQAAAQALLEHDAALHDHVKSPTGRSRPYPAALSDAAREQLGLEEDILSAPNNILALEYCKALLRMGSTMQPVTALRAGAGHDALLVNGAFASARAIRQMIQAGDLTRLAESVPAAAWPLYREMAAVDFAALDPVITAALRRESAEQLRRYAGVSGGLEHRLLRAGARCATFSDIVDDAKTKHYLYSRISRALCCLLLGIRKDGAYHAPPQYFRILALNEKGAQVVRASYEEACLPFITKPADAMKQLSAAGQEQFTLDCRATDLFALCTPNKQGGQDYIHSPVFVSESGDTDQSSL